jgi:hypothetical protein
MKRNARMLLLLLTAMISIGCGNQDPDDMDGTDDPSDGGTPPGKDYYPLKVGYSWRYLETFDDGSPSNELTYAVTDMRTEDVEGLGKGSVFNVENSVIDDDILDDDEQRVQEIWDDGKRAMRLNHTVYVNIVGDLVPTKIRRYEPGFLRFDRERLEINSPWQETLTRYSDPLEEDKPSLVEERTYTYTVLGVEEQVEVPAGKFTCIKISRVSPADEDNEQKTYWFAEGVGKVKEEDDLSVEELTEYVTE